MYREENDEDTLEEQLAYVPDNIWGWDGLARALRLKRVDPAVRRNNDSTPRILERVVHVGDLRHSMGDS